MIELQSWEIIMRLTSLTQHPLVTRNYSWPWRVPFPWYHLQRSRMGELSAHWTRGIVFVTSLETFLRTDIDGAKGTTECGVFCTLSAYQQHAFAVLRSNHNWCFVIIWMCREFYSYIWNRMCFVTREFRVSMENAIYLRNQLRKPISS